MKKIIFLVFLSISCLMSSASISFDSQTRYYLTSNFRSGYLGLSSYHFENYNYELYMYDGREDNRDDRYWYISGDDSSGYIFQNASSGEYMSWSEDYSIKRNLEMVDEVNDDCLWDIVIIDENQPYVAIRHRNNPDYHLNIRSSGYVANYNNRFGENTFTSSDQFRIFDENGNEVIGDGEQPTPPYGYDTTDKWSGNESIHIFGDWTSNNKDVHSSTSTHTITFDCVEGALITFDWSVSSETNCDFFSAELDGSTIIYNQSGTAKGSYTSPLLSAKTHTLVFRYEKDHSVSDGNDAATVSNIVLNNAEAKILYIQCYDKETGNLLETYQHVFLESYILTSWPEFEGYDFSYSDASLGSTFTSSRTISVFYTLRPFFAPTTIVDGNFAPETTWYRLSIRGGKQVYTNDLGDAVQVRCDMMEKVFDPAYFWCFVSLGNGEYQVYNYATGPNVPLSAESAANNTALLMNAGGTYNTFNVTPNGNGFNLQLPNVDPSSCCNDSGNRGVLMLWTDGYSTIDGGSRFIAEEVDEPVFSYIEHIYLNETDIQLAEDETYNIPVYYTPEHATQTRVKWSSNNTKVATIDNYGNVKAVAGGDAIITVCSYYDENISASCTVHVTAHVRVTSITTTPAITLSIGETHKLDATVSPADAYNRSITWRSNNSDVARVSSDGTITAIAPGKATITVTANDDSGCYATCVVTVKDPSAGKPVAHDGTMLYLIGANDRLVALPVDYVSNSEYIYEGTHFSANLISGEALEYDDITAVEQEMPFALPAFESYKFNNDFNYQVFTTAETETPEASEFTIPVGGIGKYLTASFKLPDGAYAWVDGKLQESKKTRLHFDNPTTYTIGRYNWQEVQLFQFNDNNYEMRLLPFGHKTTVTVDWLCDHSSNTNTVPEIYIKTEDGEPITSKTTYKTATIEIRGGGVFPDFPEQEMLIKGRGNTSWGYSSSKNPYRIKFETKVKPLGMPKQKSWILLANKLSGSMTTNAVEHKIASLMESDSPCNIIPVELYINGQYEGSYNFCQKLGFSKSSIDILDETYASIVEIDTNYESDGTPNLRDRTYGMSYKIHEPDLYDYDYTGELTAEQVIEDFNRMTAMVAEGTYDRCVDIKSLVAYLATCDLSMHRELMHSKSVFCYSENVIDGFNLESETDPTLWHFGPIWDCDWSFGYEGSSQYFQSEQTSDFYSLLQWGSNGQFWNDLRYNNPEVDRYYFYRFKQFMSEGNFEELLAFCDEYYAFAAKSLSHNPAGAYAYDSNDYAKITSSCKSWLKERANYIMENLNAYEFPAEFAPGDLNADGFFTIADIAWITRIALGLAPDLYGTADVNGDGHIDRNDVVELANRILKK